ncbi:serine/threonine-protein kinase [Streptomyces sp. NBC_00443]|uniref:serine/threonine-protein kinase n=1 Tax=Streptomyces sp. NBC_00443 TaxID=2975743 RepID=UPI002E1DBE17
MTSADASDGARETSGAGDSTLGAPAPRLPAGFRIEGWELGAVIGSGGWGTVYEARSVADGTTAAVKVLPTGGLAPGQRAALSELVAREVRFSAEADHPHLVRTRAVCTVDAPELPALNGAIALVMDRAEASLRQVLDAAGTGRPILDAVGLLRGVAAGLAHMHDAGWVHGDLKPANVLLGGDGEVWLADFGLATELEGTHAHMPPLGTLDHLPPEWWSQRTGADGSVVRPTADIWAFGVLAHQVLTGGLHPFSGATARARSLAAQAYARGSAPLRLDAGLEQDWRRLIADCLAPDHAARLPHTAAGLAARIDALSGGVAAGSGCCRPAVWRSPVPQPPPPPSPLPSPSPGSHCSAATMTRTAPVAAGAARRPPSPVRPSRPPGKSRKTPTYPKRCGRSSSVPPGAAPTPRSHPRCSPRCSRRKAASTPTRPARPPTSTASPCGHHRCSGPGPWTGTETATRTTFHRRTPSTP